MGRKEKKEKKDKKRRRRSSSSSSDRGGRKRTRVAASGWDAQPLVPRGPLAGFAPIPGAPGGLPGVPGVPGAATPPPPGQLAITPPPPGAAAEGALVLAGSQPPQAAPQVEGDFNTRRLYVGNVALAMDETMLRNFFRLHATAIRRRMYNKKAEEAKAKNRPAPTPPDDSVSPVLDIVLSPADDPKRRFAFVQLNEMDLTTECLTLDGKSCPLPDGSLVQLKVSRPKNYIAPTPVATTMLSSKQATQFVQGLPPSASGKLALAGFPSNMGTDELKELLATFGTVSSFEVVGEADGASRHCCVFDYDEGEEAGDECINALNGIDIAEERLLVHRVGAGALVLHDGAAGGAGGGMDKKEAERVLLQNIITFGMGLYQSLEGLRDLMDADADGKKSSVQAKKPTKILGLLNLFDEEDLEDDRNYDNIKAEIEKEAEKYGRVVNLTIPREPPPPPPPPITPEAPQLLLQLQTGPLAITNAPTPSAPGAEADPADLAQSGPPPGFALNVNTNALVPYAQMDEERAKIDAENEAKKKAWEKECEKLEADFEKERAKWEEDIQDPIKNGVGKVFIEYWTEEEALKAQVALAGKQFDNRTVITSFLPDEWFHEPAAENDDSFDAIMAALDGPDGDTLAIEG